MDFGPSIVGIIYRLGYWDANVGNGHGGVVAKVSFEWSFHTLGIQQSQNLKWGLWFFGIRINLQLAILEPRREVFMSSSYPIIAAAVAIMTIVIRHRRHRRG
jgi:hypothetical protein